MHSEQTTIGSLLDRVIEDAQGLRFREDDDSSSGCGRSDRDQRRFDADDAGGREHSPNAVESMSESIWI